jgi:hypothetical protein
MALASPISPVTPATAGPSWNPLKFRGTPLPTELLILVKVLALVVLLVNHVRILPDPWLPFVPGVDRIPPILFQRTLQTVFVTCALALLFNRRVRLASLVLGATMLIAVVSSKAYYGNNKTFCALMFFLTGLYVPGRKPWMLQWQLAITYFGAGLNKLLDADWHNGIFFENWAVNRLHQPWYMVLNSVLPPMVLARLMGWGTIVTELAVVPAILIRRLQSQAACANILFQSGLLLFTGSTFTLFFYSMSAASLAFVTWPAEPVTVGYDIDSGLVNRIRKVLQFCDADRRFGWTPHSRDMGDWFHLPIGNRVYTNFRALRMIVLLNPITYLAIATLIASVPDVPAAAGYRRVVVASCLFFLMPPLASIADRILGHRQTDRLTATGVANRLTDI